jgi:hypothetical protein
LIGINVAGNNAKQLKHIMERENLTWRTFADPGNVGQGAIATSWNVAGTPTLYIIDHKGVIRHKWVGSPSETAIDKALDRLIRAAEEPGGNARR